MLYRVRQHLPPRDNRAARPTIRAIEKNKYMTDKKQFTTIDEYIIDEAETFKATTKFVKLPSTTIDLRYRPPSSRPAPITCSCGAWQLSRRWSCHDRVSDTPGNSAHVVDDLLFRFSSFCHDIGAHITIFEFTHLRVFLSWAG